MIERRSHRAGIGIAASGGAASYDVVDREPRDKGYGKDPKPKWPSQNAMTPCHETLLWHHSVRRFLMRNILIFACLAATRLVVPSSALVAPPSATCIRRPSRGSVFSGADLPQAVSKYPAARIAPLPSFVNTHSHAVAGRVPWEKLWLSRKQWGRLVRNARLNEGVLECWH